MSRQTDAAALKLASQRGAHTQRSRPTPASPASPDAKPGASATKAVLLTWLEARGIEAAARESKAELLAKVEEA